MYEHLMKNVFKSARCYIIRYCILYVIIDFKWNICQNTIQSLSLNQKLLTNKVAYLPDIDTSYFNCLQISKKTTKGFTNILRELEKRLIALKLLKNKEKEKNRIDLVTFWKDQVLLILSWLFDFLIGERVSLISCLY